MQTVTSHSVTSSDGTSIAFDRTGKGLPIILVVGAFNDRSTGAPLAQSLQSHFSVFTYDRRGRGASEDTLPYAVERELDDLAALIAEAGGSAAVFGYSSGAVLALAGVARGLPITRLALYEAPFNADGKPRQPAVDHAAHLAMLVAAGRRSDAVEYFQTKVVGIPLEVSAQLRHAPFWAGLEQTAHTLVYEMTIIGDGAVPADLATSVTVPTLVLAGGESPASLREAAQVLADAVPNAQLRTLAGQTHDLVPAVLAPVLHDFFSV
jgi:pimeloyl-ACP methyl ester carboxylesterase